jgi:hypothetical protein
LSGIDCGRSNSVVITFMWKSRSVVFKGSFGTMTLYVSWRGEFLAESMLSKIE